MSPPRVDLRDSYYKKLGINNPATNIKTNRSIEFTPITLDDKVKQVTLSADLEQQLQLITKDDTFFENDQSSTFEISEIGKTTKLSEQLKQSILKLIFELNLTDNYVIKINTINKKLFPPEYFDKFAIHLDWFNRQFEDIQNRHQIPSFETCMIYCGKRIRPTKLVPFCPNKLLRQFKSCTEFHYFQMNHPIETMHFESRVQWIPINILHQAPERETNSVVISFRMKDEIEYFNK